MRYMCNHRRTVAAAATAENAIHPHITFTFQNINNPIMKNAAILYAREGTLEDRNTLFFLKVLYEFFNTLKDLKKMELFEGG